MSGSCVPVEELGRVARLPAGHPERRHLDDCTRCQTLLVMLKAFETQSDRPEDAGFEAADPQLRATIEGLLREELARAESPPVRDPYVRRPATNRTGLWPRLARPRLALAFAALIAVSGAGVVLWRLHEPPTAMRAVPSQLPGGTVFASEPAVQVVGGVELRWGEVPGATGYRVVFLDSTLHELARLEPADERAVRLMSNALPAGLVHGATVGWQVEALAGNDRLARTRTRALRVP